MTPECIGIFIVIKKKDILERMSFFNSLETIYAPTGT